MHMYKQAQRRKQALADLGEAAPFYGPHKDKSESVLGPHAQITDHSTNINHIIMKFSNFTIT